MDQASMMRTVYYVLIYDFQSHKWRWLVFSFIHPGLSSLWISTPKSTSSRFTLWWDYGSTTDVLGWDELDKIIFKFPLLDNHHQDRLIQ